MQNDGLTRFGVKGGGNSSKQKILHRQREKQAPCRESDVGLDPGSPGSHPGLQAALNCCATGVAPNQSILSAYVVQVCFHLILKMKI